MVEIASLNILICSKLQKERVLFFNYFDEHDASMIYSENDMIACRDLLKNENIDCLIIDYGEGFIQKVSQLIQLKNIKQKFKIILLIDQNKVLSENKHKELLDNSDKLFFTPVSKLEVYTKLSEIFSQKASSLHTQHLAKTTGDRDEMWNALFKDSSRAKIIVAADTQKIIHANESLLCILGLTKKQIVGKSWKVLDNNSNHSKYQNYIKEINSSEKLKFIINHHLHKEREINFEADYQLSVLDGEIVFIGELIPEKNQVLSKGIYQSFIRATTINIYADNFKNNLIELKQISNLEFIIFSKIIDDEFCEHVATSNDGSVMEIIDNQMAFLYSIVKETGIIEFDVNSSHNSEISIIFSMLELSSFFVHLIQINDINYGIVIAGNKNINIDVNTHSLLIRTIVQQIRFALFQKQASSQKLIDGKVDKLTRLPNRNSMTTKFSEILEKGISSEKYLSLIVIDIDKLNYLNKSIGIELTDEVIITVAKIIEKSINVKGQIYRLSGNEFVVLLHPHLEKSLAEQEVRLIIDLLNKPILISNGEEVNINFNIGVSIFPDAGQTVSSMVKNADLAMYDAKLVGKNNYIIFKYSETGQALKQRTEMVEKLKKAIENDHIKVFYQPKIDAVNEDVIGFEALVRWIDPEQGVINPGHFIPLAEDTKLINRIGEIVAKQSCRKIVEWQKRYGLSLTCSINLSAVQLMDDNLPSTLETIVNESGIHPHYIDFEITETISLDVVPNLVESLNKIVEFGSTLSIDDFGTGHSSLDYVKKIPAQYIKIDQSFVKNIGVNPEDEAILDATIDIAKRLNRKIVAEGVETEEQREYLVDRGVEFFQGFLFARPMPEKQIEKLFDQRAQLMGVE